MKNSIKKGFSFGLTSGIITTLGLMVGMYAGTHSKIVVVGAILVIAIADSLSDGLGMHLSEESQKSSTKKGIWQATFSATFTKFIIALTFLIPIFVFSLSSAIIASIIWGMLLLLVFSYFIAKNRNDNPLWVILEHLVIAIIVIIVSYFVGQWIGERFN
jgi:VIT1/CCC1 family predicted Fe2+/Mn2+ transporter